MFFTLGEKSSLFQLYVGPLELLVKADCLLKVTSVAIG